MSSSEFAYINYLDSVMVSMDHYLIIITLPIGIIGNLFSFYIYTRPNLNKKTNTGFLYAWFCLLKLALLLYFSFVYASYTLYGAVVLEFPCGINIFLQRIIWCCVAWCLVLVSFDRFIYVVYPFKAYIMNKKWVLYLIMLAILVLNIALNSANLVEYTVSFSFYGTAITYCLQTPEANIATSILTIVSLIYFPFVLMLVFDLIAWRKLKKSKIRVGVANVTQIGQQPNQPGEITNKEYKFIKSTIFIDITFFVFYTPLAVFSTLFNIMTINVSLVDSLTYTWIFLFYNISQNLALVYSVASFFIFAKLNRYFRAEVITLLRLKKLFPCLSNQLVSATNNNMNSSKVLSSKKNVINVA